MVWGILEASLLPTLAKYLLRILLNYFLRVTGWNLIRVWANRVS